MIVKKKNKFAVMDSAGNTVLGTHKTRKKAANQLAAIEANKKEYFRGGRVAMTGGNNSLIPYAAPLYGAERMVSDRQDPSARFVAPGMANTEQSAFEQALFNWSIKDAAQREMLGLGPNDPMMYSGAATPVALAEYLTPYGDVVQAVEGVNAITEGELLSGAALLGLAGLSAVLPGTLRPAGKAMPPVSASSVPNMGGDPLLGHLRNVHHPDFNPDANMRFLNPDPSDSYELKTVKDIFRSFVNDSNYSNQDFLTDMLQYGDLEVAEKFLREASSSPNLTTSQRSAINLMYNNISELLVDEAPDVLDRLIRERSQEGMRFTSDWFGTPEGADRLREKLGEFFDQSQQDVPGMLESPSSVMYEDGIPVMVGRDEWVNEVMTMYTDRINRNRVGDITANVSYEPGLSRENAGWADGFSRINISPNQTPISAGTVGSHEGSHWVSDFGNAYIGVNETIAKSMEDAIPDDRILGNIQDAINGKEGDWTEYIFRPQEMTSFAQEIRYLLNLKPSDVVTPEMIYQNLGYLASVKSARYAEYARIMGGAKNFSNFWSDILNKIPAMAPIGLGLGGAAAVRLSQDNQPQPTN
jgi:hypothetical protein